MTGDKLIRRREFAVGLVEALKPRRNTDFDIAIIGAGVFGCWIARECKQHGRSVLLLDARGPGNSLASSGGESRILRIGYGPQDLYSIWAADSLREWQILLRSLHKEDMFIRSGVLWLGDHNDDYLLATMRSLSRLGAHFLAMDLRQLRYRFPQITLREGSIGILELDSGFVLARRAVAAMLDHLIAIGVTYRKALIRMPLEIGSSVTEIAIAEGNPIRAKQYVFACGPWLPKLFPTVLGNCITPTRQEVFFIATPPGDSSYGAQRFPAWVDFAPDHIFYGVPDFESRGFKVASDKHGRVIDPDEEERLATVEGLSEVRSFLKERFPALSRNVCIESRVCQYENSPSGDFIIDRHPNASNAWIVGAGSGHGFKHGPAVGKYVVSLLNGGKADERFSIAKAQFENSRTVHD